jgi:hypothetical protein
MHYVGWILFWKCKRKSEMSSTIEKVSSPQRSSLDRLETVRVALAKLVAGEDGKYISETDISKITLAEIWLASPYSSDALKSEAASVLETELELIQATIETKKLSDKTFQEAGRTLANLLMSNIVSGASSL